MRRRVLVVSGVVAAMSAATLVAVVSGGGGDPGFVADLQSRELARPAFASLRAPADLAAAASLRSAQQDAFLSSLGVNPADSRVAAAGPWGKVILTPMNSGPGEAGICISVVGGIQNCPSVLAVAAGEVVLPLWDQEGATVGALGVVPDGVARVTNADTGETAEVSRNVYVFSRVRSVPNDLIYAMSDGRKIKRTRIAATAPPPAP